MKFLLLIKVKMPTNSLIWSILYVIFLNPFMPSGRNTNPSTQSLEYSSNNITNNTFKRSYSNSSLDERIKVWMNFLQTISLSTIGLLRPIDSTIQFVLMLYVSNNNFSVMSRWFPVFLGFVWFDSLRPINNLSVKQGRLFLGWTSTKLG